MRFLEPALRSLLALAVLALLRPVALDGTQSVSETVLHSCSSVTFLQFSPDGRELERVCGVAFRGPMMAMLFDTSNYKKARTFPVGMRVAAYSPDGTRIVTAETEDGSHVLDATVPGKLVPQAHSQLSENHRLDTPLRVLEAPSRDPAAHVLFAVFSPDGQHLVTTHRGGLVKLWATSSWTLEADLNLTQSEVHAAAFAPDNSFLIISDHNGVLHEWSLLSKADVKTIRTGGGTIAGVAFSPDGKTLATSHQIAGKWSEGHWLPAASSASGNQVMIWSTATWTAVTRPGFGAAAWSRDGKMLALGGDHVVLLDPASLHEIRTIPLRAATSDELNGRRPKQPIPMSVVAMAFSPDGDTLAAGCLDGTVRLLKMEPQN